MFAVLFVSLIAACAAAPRFPPGPPPYRPPPPEHNHGFGHGYYDPFQGELFDTRQFWAEMANEMRQLDAMLAQFYEKFPSISSTQGVEGNQYKLTIPLNGFEEKEVVVKAREGLLMVQAVHKMEDGGERSYLDIKTLPASVDVKGTWTFEDNVLKISFPLKQEVDTEEPVTEAHSREEVFPREGNASSNTEADDNADADVGLRVDQESNQEHDRELINNEIPRNSVEATTYAVDLKDEVEFVPVRYR